MDVSRIASGGYQAEGPEGSLFEEIQGFYAKEKLQPPYMPLDMKASLITIAQGTQWATDSKHVIGDPVAWATEALQVKDMPDCLAFGYKNESIHYCLKRGPLVLAMARKWGGYSPNKAPQVNWLSAAPKLLELKMKISQNEINPNKRLILLDSDTHAYATGYKVVDVTQLVPEATWDPASLDSRDTQAIASLPLDIVDLLK